MEILAPYNGEIEQIRFAPETEYPKFALLIKFRHIPVERNYVITRDPSEPRLRISHLSQKTERKRSKNS